MDKQKQFVSLFKPPKNFSPDVGDYFPDFCINYNDLKLLDLIQNEHILLVFLSMECKTCGDALEIIDQYINRHPKINVAMFINVDINTVEELKKYFGQRAHIFSMSKQKMNEELQVFSFPRAYTLNRFGQILKVENCGAEFMLDILVQPLRKIIMKN